MVRRTGLRLHGNHADFSYPKQIIFSGSAIRPSAGVITQTATTSRQIQFALKLLF